MELKNNLDLLVSANRRDFMHIFGEDIGNHFWRKFDGQTKNIGSLLLEMTTGNLAKLNAYAQLYAAAMVPINALSRNAEFALINVLGDPLDSTIRTSCERELSRDSISTAYVERQDRWEYLVTTKHLPLGHAVHGYSCATVARIQAAKYYLSECVFDGGDFSREEIKNFSIDGDTEYQAYRYDGPKENGCTWV